MNGKAQVKKTLARTLRALTGAIAAEVNWQGVTWITLPDSTRLTVTKLPEDPEAEVNWTWMRTDAEGWFVADGGGEDFPEMLAGLVAHLRAA